MISQRMRVPALLVAVLMIGGLAGCTSKPAPAAEAVAGLAAESPVPAAACFPKPDPEKMETWSDPYIGETECYRTGICEGGAGEADGTGQCHKWAMSADGPALPWSERLTNPALGNSIPPPEDLYQGSYEMTSESCFENCQPVPVRLVEETELYAESDARSRVVATLPAGACVATDNDRLLSTPLRGIITETANGFSAGDVIYHLAYEGEGSYLAWWRGGYSGGDHFSPKVEWDPAPAVADPREGYWRELLLADGTRGWARNAEVTDYNACTLSVN